MLKLTSWRGDFNSYFFNKFVDVISGAEVLPTKEKKIKDLITRIVVEVEEMHVGIAGTKNLRNVVIVC
jgi:hypothetical protein